MTAHTSNTPKVQTGSAGTPPKVVKHVDAAMPSTSTPGTNEPKVQMGSAGTPPKVVKHLPQA